MMARLFVHWRALRIVTAPHRRRMTQVTPTSAPTELVLLLLNDCRLVGACLYGVVEWSTLVLLSRLDYHFGPSVHVSLRGTHKV